MRILVLTSWYPNQQNPVKGVFVKEQALALQRFGYEIAIFYPFDEEVPAQVVFCREEEGIMTYRANALSEASGQERQMPYYRYLARLKSYPFSLQVLRRIQGEFNPDLIHVHVGYPAAIIAWLYTRQASVPYVITEHMSYLGDYVAKLQHRLLLRRAYEKAGAVLPVSPALAEQLQSFGWQLNLRPVPNVVDTRRFALQTTRPSKGQHAEQEMRDDLNGQGLITGGKRQHAEAETNILFAGHMDESEIKGVQFLLPALANLVQEGKRVHLHLAGDGVRRPHFEQLAQSLNISEHCTFYGRLKPQAMPEFFSRGDLLVLPSLKETFGAVLIEAMSCGKPVLATACGGPESIVTPEVGRLVQPGSIPALTEGLREMLHNLNHYDPLSIRRYAEEHYGPEALVRNLTEVYEQVAKAP